MEQPAPYEPGRTMIRLTVSMRSIHATRFIEALQRLMAQKWLLRSIGRYHIDAKPERG